MPVGSRGGGLRDHHPHLAVPRPHRRAEKRAHMSPDLTQIFASGRSGVLLILLGCGVVAGVVLPTSRPRLAAGSSSPWRGAGGLRGVYATEDRRAPQPGGDHRPGGRRTTWPRSLRHRSTSSSCLAQMVECHGGRRHRLALSYRNSSTRRPKPLPKLAVFATGGGTLLWLERRDRGRGHLHPAGLDPSPRANPLGPGPAGPWPWSSSSSA